jgi:hypothetical protein
MRGLAILLCLLAAPAAASRGAEPPAPGDARVPFREAARRNLKGAEFDPGKLKLPLVVTERCGVERKGAVVTGGVPFPPGFLADVEKLRVVDSAGRAVPSQASVMIKWHKPTYDDSVQWALVSFKADVPAGGSAKYFLVDDPKVPVPETGFGLVVDGGRALVKTGAATFLVAGEGSALISEASIGEHRVIGGKGLRCEITSGDWPDRGLKKGDKLIGHVEKFLIEERGPVRLVLCLKGTFRPGDKEKKYYDFTARLYFAAGSPAVRIVYSIENCRLRPKLTAGSRHAYVWPIEDASLVADLAAGAGAGAGARTIAEGKEVEAGDLNVYQDSSGGKQWREVGGKKVRGVSFRGYRVTSAGKELAAGNAHLGVIDARAKKAGLAAALRNFRVEYPSALSASGGALRVGLFPGEFSEPFHLNPGQRESWDVKLLLHGPVAPDLKGLHAETDTLLLFRPEPAWMVRAANSGAWPAGLALLKDPRPSRPVRLDKSGRDGANAGWDRHGWIKAWNAGGYHWNQNSVFGSWLLWGDGPGFDHAEIKALWASDSCAIHYDQPAMKTFWLMLSGWNWRENRLKLLTYPGYYNRAARKHPDSGHLAMVMWMEYYLLTGDMRAREASEHLGIRARAMLWKFNHDDTGGADSPLGRAISWCKRRDADANPDFRTFNRYIGWPLYVLSQYYRLTGRPELLAECRNVARSFRNTGRYVPTGFLCLHINKKGDRGTYGGQGTFGKFRDQSASQCYAHFQMGIMVTGLAEYYLMSRDIEALDTMIGFADFMCHHCMLRDPQGRRVGWNYVFGDYWGPYTYKQATGRGGASYNKCTWMVSNFRVVQPLGAIYGFTGRKDYREVLVDALATLRKPNFSVIAGHMAVAHPKVDSEPPGPVKDLAAEALGGGRVKLTWTAPKGGVAWYQVKHSTSPIVERVAGWPDRSEPQPADKKEWVARVKAFQKKNLAFWQAENAKGEPAPGKPGEKREMTVGGLSAGKVHFALKSWDAADNVSDISNVVAVEVR